MLGMASGWFARSLFTGIASCVMALPVGVLPPPIELDNPLFPEAQKVANVSAHRYISPKLEACKAPRARVFPQRLPGQGRGLTQLGCAPRQAIVRFGHPACIKKNGAVTRATAPLS